MSLFENTLKSANTLIPGWELLFTETLVPMDAEIFRRASGQLANWRQKGSLGFMDIGQHYLAGITSVFVHRNAIAKVAGLIAGEWRRGQPLDMYLRDLIRSGRIKAHLTLPFLTTFEPGVSNNSEIRGALDASHRATDIYRRSFFIESDVTRLREEMMALAAGAKMPAHAALFVDLMAFAVSDRWVPF